MPILSIGIVRASAVAAALAVVPLSCRDLPPVDERGSFAFGVFGDGPYEWTENGRFERLQEDFERLCGLLGVERQKPLPHLNKTQHAPYWEYYDGIS